MIITVHKDSKVRTTAIHAQSETLGMRMVLRPGDSCFRKIQVYEKGLLGLFWQKFLFEENVFGNYHSIKDGFYADGLLAKDDELLQDMWEYTSNLKRDFFDEKTQEHISGCIMRVESQKGKMTQAELFDFVGGVLVPVAFV